MSRIATPTVKQRMDAADRIAETDRKLMGIKASDWASSCDFCKFQEGRHYCLLHSSTLKNMDAITCPKWEGKDA